MKKVLRTVIDKNGNAEEVFSPTAQMILYGIFKADFPGLADKDVCAKAGVNSSMPAKWMLKYGTHFTDWLEEMIDSGTSDDARVLERVGMIQATQGNFQFWREMARTKGVIKEAEQKVGLTLNTDFTQILIAVGGDFNAARQQLLSAHRGVVEQAQPRLAIPASGGGSGEHSSAGDGASGVQAEPVAVPNSLGADGRRPKQRTAVPAVSK